MPDSEKIVFGPYEFDLATGRLAKHGMRMKLQPRAATVLSCLLERPGETVTREQLQRRMWPDGTYVDFEIGIKVAVKKVRDALGDSADEPKYVQTVHGEGYRFIGTAAAVQPTTAVTRAEEPCATPVAGVAIPRRWWKLWVPAAAFVCIAISVVAIHLKDRVSTVPYHTGDFVLIAAFDNRTGDPQLSGSLEYALRHELDNSQFVQTVAPERVNDTLALMRRPADTTLNEATAREVCLRDGDVKLLLTGRVEKIGSAYAITISIVDPPTGKILRSTVQKASSEDKVLEAVHRAANDIRGVLGEDLAQIQLSQRKLEKVTTPSLEALKLFNLGYQLFMEARFNEALDCFRGAVAADPDFATAWLFVGWTIPRTGTGLADDAKDNAKQIGADQAFRRAFELSDRVSERERLFILESWYMLNGNSDKAIYYGELLANLYPDHYWGINNLIFLMSAAHRDRESLAFSRQLFRIRPDARVALSLAAMYRTSYPTVAVEFWQQGEEIARKTGDSAAEFLAELQRADLDWDKGDYRAALTRIEKLRPTRADDVLSQALALLAFGRLHEAEEVARRFDEDTMIGLYAAFLSHGWRGVREFAAENAPPRGRTSSGTLLLYAMGASAPKRRIAAEQARTQLIGEKLLSSWDEAVTGEVALQRGDYRTAIRKLKFPLVQTVNASVILSAAAYELVPDLLATAYERLGDIQSAIAVLEEGNQRIGTPSLGQEATVLRPMLLRHQADLYRRTGAMTKAAAIEQQLSAILNNADPDYSLDAQRGVVRNTASAMAHR